MEESAIKTIAIVWVALIPPAVSLSIFCFIVLAADRHRIAHYLVTSSLIGRLGHCCIAIILWSIFTLEHWHWPKEICYILTWSWITCWIGDIFTSFIFLLYYNVTYGKGERKATGFLLLFSTWVLAMLVGGIPVFMETSFYNYNPDLETCVLDAAQSSKTMRTTVLLICIIGPLFCFVLCVTINAEFKSLRTKHRLYCRTNSLNIQNTITVNTVNNITSSIGNHINGSNANNINHNKVINIETNNLNKTASSSNGNTNQNVNTQQTGSNSDGAANQNTNLTAQDLFSNNEAGKCGIMDRGNGVKECSYISNCRDTRNLLNCMTCSTIILNCIPQLVIYAIEIITGTASEYTHYILVSFGLVHSLALPVLVCMATYRYCFLSIQILETMCCHRKYRARHSKAIPSRQNNTVDISSPVSSTSNNIQTTQNASTVSIIIENNADNLNSNIHEVAVNPIIPIHLNTDTLQAVAPSPAPSRHSYVSDNGVLMPPALPTSRHPSFQRSPMLNAQRANVVRSTAQISYKETEAGASSSGNKNMSIKIEEIGSGNINQAYVSDIESPEEVIVASHNHTDTTIDNSIQSFDIEAEHLKNRPRNVLDVSKVNVVRSNSAVVIPASNGEKDIKNNIRRTSSSAHEERNEGPFVEWTETTNTGTLFMKRVKSGDQSYLSSDYHHDKLDADDIALEIGGTAGNDDVTTGGNDVTTEYSDVTKETDFIRSGDTMLQDGFQLMRDEAVGIDLDAVDLADIPRDGGEFSYSDEEGSDSSYYDSDSAGWSHMYTDTDMDTSETLERNKEKLLQGKSAAKRIPSNNSSLEGELQVVVKKKRDPSRKKKKKKRKTKPDKNAGLGLESGLGSAMMTMMFMPGAQMTKPGISKKPNVIELSQNPDKDKLSLQVNVDTKVGVNQQVQTGRFSPAIGIDGKLIEIPPPPPYAAPPPPYPGLSKQTGQYLDSSVVTKPIAINAAPKFPSQVLPFKSNFVLTNQVHEMQSFSREPMISPKQNVEEENNINAADDNVNMGNNTQTKFEEAELEEFQQTVDADIGVVILPNYHPSIYSIVKERTKAQKAWHKAFNTVSVTEFLKRKPSSLGVFDNEDNLKELGKSNLRRGARVSREMAHTYVNVGTAGSYAGSQRSDESSSLPKVNKAETLIAQV